MKEEKNQEKEEVVVRKESQVFDDTMRGIKDAASLELMKPVLSRTKSRMKALEEKSKAKHVKIMQGDKAIWHTEKPEMFVSGLSSKIENGCGIITYYTYKLDSKGEKLLVTNDKEVYDERTGEKRTVAISAEYPFDKLVVERIEYMKPLKTEVTKLGE